MGVGCRVLGVGCTVGVRGLGFGGYLDKVTAGLDGLPGHGATDAHTQRQEGAHYHVAHGEEDGVLEAPHGEQVFVEEDDADVRKVPRREQGPHRHMRPCTRFGAWGVGCRV